MIYKMLPISFQEFRTGLIQKPKPRDYRGVLLLEMRERDYSSRSIIMISEKLKDLDVAEKKKKAEQLYDLFNRCSNEEEFITQLELI